MYKSQNVDLITDINVPVLTVSQIAELSGIHAQTVRQYDRLGLITGHRTKGKSRRFTLMDVERIRQIQLMSQEEGINLNGIRRILTLSEENRMIKRQLLALHHDSIFNVSSDGQAQITHPSHPREKSVRGLIEE